LNQRVKHLSGQGAGLSVVANILNKSSIRYFV
jgi:hypothetical protein